MKKTLVSIVAVMLLACMLCACSAKNNGEANNGGANATEQPVTEVKLEGTLPEIIDKIYAIKNTGLALMTQDVDIANADTLKYYTGLDSAELITEASYSEAMIGSQAYSMVLVRVKDGANLQTVAQSMKNGINQSKWICVTADDMQVVGYGDVVMLIMIDSQLAESATSDEIVEAFRQVCGAELTVVLK